MTAYSVKGYQDAYHTGDTVFVSEVVTERGECEIHLTEAPRRTNRSREPRLRGWCGSTNNRAVTALGVGKVTRVRGTVLRVEVLAAGSDEENDALGALGWSALATTGRSGTQQENGERRSPVVSVSMSRETLAALDALAEGTSRSAVVTALVDAETARRGR